MNNLKNTILVLKKNDYYNKVLNILILNGLLDVFEEEIKDGKIDYVTLIVNVIAFLEKNKKELTKLNKGKFEDILILSINEILSKKFNLELDEKTLEKILVLVKNSFLIRSLTSGIKDVFLKIKECMKKI